MDPKLIVDAARIAMLGYGLSRNPDVDGPFNVSVRDVVLWRLLREQFGQLDFDEMRDALEGDSAAFSENRYVEEVLVDGVYSKSGYQFQSSPVHPKKFLAKRVDYEDLIREWKARPLPVVVVLSMNEVALTTAPVSVELINEGMGGASAIEVRSIQAPSWLRIVRSGNELKLSSQVPGPGVYHSVVSVDTNGGISQLVVTAERLDFPAPDDDYVLVDAFYDEQEEMDIPATRRRVESYLVDLGFELLPGGAAVQLEVKPERIDTIRVRLERTYIIVGEVPLPHRVDPEPVLVDEDGHEPGYDVFYSHGILSGLRDMFVDYGARPGQYLVLRLRSRGYEFAFEEPDLLQETHGYRYWVMGSAEALNALPNLKRALRNWISEGEVNILVSGWKDNPFTQSITALHKSGTVSVKTSGMPLQSVIIVESETEVAINLETGNLIEFSKDVGFLWRQGEFLGGEDVRNKAQSSGTESVGLTLPLSPEQRRLADLLRPMAIPSGTPQEILQQVGMLEPTLRPPDKSPASRQGADEWWFVDPATYTRLLRLSTSFQKEQNKGDGRGRILPSKKILAEHGVTAGQVNYFDRPIRVTQGGWIATDPTTASLTEIAEAVAGLTAEPMHHSQLRQICEAFVGETIDAAGFLQASLRACGWAGPGYRRARLKNEPAGTNLQDVVRSLMAKGYLRKHEVILAARQYLRVPSERIAKAFDDVRRSAGTKVAA